MNNAGLFFYLSDVPAVIITLLPGDSNVYLISYCPDRTGSINQKVTCYIYMDKNKTILEERMYIWYIASRELYVKLLNI